MAAEEASGAPTQAANSASDDPAAPCAWQPFTPKGVGAFALAPVSHLLWVQLVMALLVAACLSWFVGANYFPQITAAIKQLPEVGEIRGGQVQWTNAVPQILAEHRLLALAVDLNHSGQARSPAHLLVEFGRHDILFVSLGQAAVSYPDGMTIAFNRVELDPWWGAWAPPILAMIFLGGVAGLLMTWALLAMVYSAPACLLAFFANRECGLGRGWKLAGAALMPGAVVLAVGIVVYGVGGVNLVELLVLWAMHFVVGWVFIATAVFRLPSISGVTSRGNPFGS